ncbi:polyvinyl alcohol dehydrogenase (cytochrome) [Povalibacter uvarum]|uniref:Polyvinyl alcohol dehydrogenase (Cytochrome) n=1 Tax=Povalibacter uvarum TaxID=732238 RepID=A0A841HHE4_9GAMM|nr:PQQ-binding-like beta-propeller repeat protein [Povalibacter uvarum]MBB6091984.1 polyvinyl alcohol dehydrogenase (cytochrome) [Povalibacter uvarum]
MKTKTIALATLLSAASIAPALAQELRADHPGKKVYDTYCAACHAQPATRAPALSALQQMNAQHLRQVLTEGVMQQQGAIVPKEQFPDLLGYLAAPDAAPADWVAGMMCKPDARDVDLTQPASMSMFGTDHRNSRRLTATQAGLKSADLPNLELAWAIAFPKTTSLRASPVIVGSTMFFSAGQAGKLLALDTRTACVKWAYDAGVPLRSSVSYGELGTSGKKAIIFGDARANIHSLDAKTGALLWKAEGRHDKQGQITGAAVLYKDRVIVPVSSSGVGSGANPTFECCTGHGAVVALDAVTGNKLWTAHTMEDAQYTGKTSPTGVKLRGPSGAPIWSTPSVDEKRSVTYAATGQNTSLPATTTSDAILAIDLATGDLKWSFQALAKDVWHLGCQADSAKSGPNCPKPEDSVLKDYDFGAGVVISRRPNGKDVLLAGQKSGDLWALDPDDKGRVLWRQTFGHGTPLGGIHWGIAVDDERVFAPINDPFAAAGSYVPEPGMNAVNIDTGKVAWRKPVTPDCSNGRDKRYDLCHEKYGLSAAPLVVDKSVVAGALDGRIYIYDAATGDIVWQYDTLRDFETVNGIPGKGGGIDSHSVFAGDGMLFVGSGYGGFRQPPGNVLLGFRVKRK